MDRKSPIMNSATQDSSSSNSTSPDSSPSTGNSPAQPRPQNQAAMKRILIIDSEPTRRKERVSALKQRGFAVYPALKIEEARTRCKRGTYDLIIVSVAANPQAAMQLADEIKQGNPAQLVLLMSAQGTAAGVQNGNSVSDEPKALVERVEAMLGSRPNANPVAA